MEMSLLRSKYGGEILPDMRNWEAVSPEPYRRNGLYVPNRHFRRQRGRLFAPDYSDGAGQDLSSDALRLLCIGPMDSQSVRKRNLGHVAKALKDRTNGWT